jgi:hypothetical protein
LSLSTTQPQAQAGWSNYFWIDFVLCGKIFLALHRISELNRSHPNEFFEFFFFFFARSITYYLQFVSFLSFNYGTLFSTRKKEEGPHLVFVFNPEFFFI